MGLEEGDVVRITGDAVYYGKTEEVPDWVNNKTWIIRSISGDRAVIDKSEGGWQECYLQSDSYEVSDLSKSRVLL